MYYRNKDFESINKKIKRENFLKRNIWIKILYGLLNIISFMNFNYPLLIISLSLLILLSFLLLIYVDGEIKIIIIVLCVFLIILYGKYFKDIPNYVFGNTLTLTGTTYNIARPYRSPTTYASISGVRLDFPYGIRKGPGYNKYVTVTYLPNTGYVLSVQLAKRE